MKEAIDAAKLASSFANSTGCNVFLTGKAGTGKTTFMRELIATTHKKAVVAAPTGIAAINAGGVTLHSLFHLPFGTIVPSIDGVNVNNLSENVTTHQGLLSKLTMNSAKMALLREMELLVIDEVSMLRADILDAIDVVLRHVRRNKSRPFGGVQVLFIGDLLQLPPVVKNQEWDLLKWHYNSMFFFDANVLKDKPLIYLELEEIYRQSDEEFIELLENFRIGKVSSESLSILQSKYKPNIDPTTKEGWIYLTTHNHKADRINARALEKLPRRKHSFSARIDGTFNEHQYPVEFTLELKEGAQVMFIKNDYSGNRLYFNGKIGIIDSIDDDSILVSFPDGSEPATIEPYTWENKKYSLDTETNEISEKVEGTFTHLPIKLAWAITIHKSQGLTFEKAIIDFADAFAAGQAYVALSRLTSLDGLLLASPVPSRTFDADGSIISFSENKKSAEELKRELEIGTLLFAQDEVEKTFLVKPLSGLFHSIIISIKEGKGKSKKVEHIPWLEQQKNEIEAIDEVGQKFINQLKSNRAFESKEKLKYLSERLGKAQDYFVPALQKVSEGILNHAKEVSEESGNKKYVGELEAVEAAIRSKVKAIFKLSKLIESITENSILDKQTARNPEQDQLGQAIRQDFAEFTGTKSRRKKDKPKKEREPMIPSRDITLELLKSGMAIDEIAIERGFAKSTIEGHLAWFVEQGLLDASQLVEPKKMEMIFEALKVVQSSNLGDIMAVLGDEVTYSDLRFVLAQYGGKIFNEKTALKTK